MSWWGWLVAGLVIWIALAVPLGLVIGLTIRTADANTPCRTCGHTALMHTHHREGTECAECACPRLRPARRGERIAPPTPTASRDDGEHRQTG